MLRHIFILSNDAIAFIAFRFSEVTIGPMNPLMVFRLLLRETGLVLTMLCILTRPEAGLFRRQTHACVRSRGPRPKQRKPLKRASFRRYRQNKAPHAPKQGPRAPPQIGAQESGLGVGRLAPLGRPPRFDAFRRFRSPRQNRSGNRVF